MLCVLESGFGEAWHMPEINLSHPTIHNSLDENYLIEKLASRTF